MVRISVCSNGLAPAFRHELLCKSRVCHNPYDRRNCRLYRVHDTARSGICTRLCRMQWSYHPHGLDLYCHFSRPPLPGATQTGNFCTSPIGNSYTSCMRNKAPVLRSNHVRELATRAGNAHEFAWALIRACRRPLGSPGTPSSPATASRSPLHASSIASSTWSKSRSLR